MTEFDLNGTIAKRREEIEILRCRAEKCTQSLTFEPKGNSNENLREDAICRMVDCKIELHELKKKEVE